MHFNERSAFDANNQFILPIDFHKKQAFKKSACFLLPIYGKQLTFLITQMIMHRLGIVGVAKRTGRRWGSFFFSLLSPFLKIC